MVNNIKFDKNGNISNQKVNYLIKHDDYTKAMIQEAKEWFNNKHNLNSKSE